MVEQLGTLFLKPSETEAAKEFEEKTGRKPIIIGGRDVLGTIRRGGGGGVAFGVDPTIEAERKLAEQLAAQKEAERKIQDQIKQQEARDLEQRRQEKIRSGTLVGQIEAAGKPSQIGVAPSLFEQAEALGTGVPKPSPKFSVDLFRQAGREFFFVDGTPIQAFGTLVSPLRGGGKAGDVEFKSPQFGTISDASLPFGAGGGEVTTGFEVAKGRALADPTLLIPSSVTSSEIASEVASEITEQITPLLQEQITSGEITLEEAETQFEREFGKVFEKEFETKFEERRPQIERGIKFRGSVTSLEEPAFDPTQFAELAGIGALSLTPPGQVIIGTSFVASGLPKVTGGETPLERGLGAAEIGIGFLGGGLAVRGAERAADIALVQELQSQKALVIGKEIIKTPKGVLLDLTTLRSVGGEGQLITKTRVPTFQTGADTFSITGGKGVTKLRFFSIEKGKFITTEESFVFGARGSVSSQPPKFSFKDLGLKTTQEDLDLVGTFGTGFVRKRGEDIFKEFQFGGVSKKIKTDVGGFQIVRGGRIDKLLLEDTAPLFRGGLTFKRVKGRVSVQEKGIIKTLDTQELGIEFLTPGKIKKTSLQQTFKDTFSPAGLSAELQKQTTASFTLPFVSAKPTTSALIGIQKAVGGEGLTQFQIQKFQGRGLAPLQELQEPLILPPGTGGRELDLLGLSDKTPFAFGVESLSLSELSKSITQQRSGGLIGTLETVFPVQQVRARQKTGLRERQLSRTFQRQLLEQPPIQRFQASPFESIGAFRPSARFGFRFPFLPLPTLGGTDKPRPKTKKRKKRKAIIRPSLTGIVLGIEEAAVITPGFGVLPGQIRGLATGFETPKKKKKVKKKKSK